MTTESFRLAIGVGDWPCRNFVLTTLANGWQTLSFDFAQQAAGTAAFNNAHTYNKASVFFDFSVAGNGQTYYFDDLAYNTAVL